MTKTIGTKVDDEIYEVLRLVCEKDGVNVSDRLRDLVNKFVKEEAPFLVINPDVCQELKRIAKEKGENWKQMTCKVILGFCEKCSGEKEKEATEEKVKIVRESELEKAKKPKTEAEKEEEGIIEVLARAIKRE